jgi:predicted amidohydrolase YtcJ
MASRITTYIVVLIVTGTVIAGLIVGAQRDDESGPVDLIITNGRVYAGGDETFAEAVAVQGNKILRVGSNREIKRLRRASTTMIDAHGAAVLPGFVDAHVHLGQRIRSAEGIDLKGAASPAALQAIVAAFAEAHPESQWIRGRGWPSELFAADAPPKQLLDAAVPDRPAYLIASDGRTAWANSRALALAGITRRTPNPNNGVIVRDPRTGEATGALRDTALGLIANVLPELTLDEQLQELRSAVDEAHRAGVTSVQSIGDSTEDLAVYDALRAADELRLRVYVALAVNPAEAETTAEQMEDVQERFPDDPLLKAGAVVLTPPYSVASLASGIAAFDTRGWQVMVDASLTSSVQPVLDAFETALAGKESRSAGRHRVEHVESLDVTTARRLAALDLVASLQPRAGEDQAVGSFRVLEAEGRLAYGSDWPDSPLDPRHVIEQLANPEDGAAAPTGSELSELQTLAPERAIDAYTSTAAWSSFDEQRKGRLAKGMLADIVILTADIFEPGRRLGDADVDVTIFDGKVVYTRPAPLGTD